MDTRYDHHLHEENIYQLWESSGAFNPDTNSNKDGNGNPFTIIMPPPNANDPLHIGHALGVTIEDILIRFHRMLGDDTLWLPGTDHAGIETQYVFEKKLQKEGQSRFQFDRQTLYQMIWDYVQENSGIAIDQMKKLGASADWSRFTFTLDPKVVEKVRETFCQLHKDGLIYRDLKLVNYCTKCGTSYSELEVSHKERQVPLYYLKYGPFTLATTRPETKFGDTAVAVHPKDKRYQQHIGQTIDVEGLNGRFSMKVIADEYVDPEFGTGVVKITPAHDFNDYEVWQRHKDEIPGLKQVIGFNGKMTELAGAYANLSVEAAREKVVADLQSRGLIDKIDANYITSIGVCYRCGRTIEPLPLPQFFLKVKDENKNLVAAVVRSLDSSETTVHGAGREQILRNWLANLNDWNLSRQIVWGIRIPVWYQVDGNEEQITISFTDAQNERRTGVLADILKNHEFSEVATGLQTMSAANGVPYVLSEAKPNEPGNWLPETDTFDTWFSSGQWPVLTLQQHHKDDFNRFYPTSVMETAYDILLFWVMRMLLLGIYVTGQSPFADVYLHGLIRDQKGQKMSKSKGNVINPLTIVDHYGADALRLALVIRSTPGMDKSFGESDFIAARNFTNKLWNAARFVLMQSEAGAGVPERNEDAISKNDEAAKQHLREVVTEVTRLLNGLKPGLAVDRLYDEFWHWLCDQQIELYKNGQLSLSVLQELLSTFIKLLHPTLPYLTEVLWQELVSKKLVTTPLLITSPWPTSDIQ